MNHWMLAVDIDSRFIKVLAARELGADLSWLLDRPKEHSVKHGEEILLQYWAGGRERQLQKESPAKGSVKRSLRSGDLQFIEGPCLPSDSQLVELLQVERKLPDHAKSLALVALCMHTSQFQQLLHGID